MTMTKATRHKLKLRAAIYGPSGSGKTYSSLAIAKGLGGRIALLDTERGSALHYAEGFGFDFDHDNLLDVSVEGYIKAINEIAKSEYDILILDSISHEWQKLLARVDDVANRFFSKNKWAGWSVGTPKQQEFVDAILGYPGHVIATMRVKTTWAIETTKAGKQKPVSVGLAPQQGKGIEYEFGILLQLSMDNVATVIKDRTGQFQGEVIEKPGVEFGQRLAQWLAGGSNQASSIQVATIMDLIESTKEDVSPLLKKANIDNVEQMNVDQAAKTINWLQEKLQSIPPEPNTRSRSGLADKPTGEEGGQ